MSTNNSRPHMFRHVSGHDIRAQVHFEKQMHAGAFLIVEGPDDAAVFQGFAHPEACSIVVSHGKKNAIEACDLLEEEGFGRAFGVIDADFDRICGAAPVCEIVCLTDCHDLDLTIFNSQALDTYLRHIGDQRAVAALTTDGIRARIFAAAEPIARVRYVNLRKDFKLNFKNLNYSAFIDQTDLVCDERKLLKEVYRNSTNPRCNEQILEKLVLEMATHSFDLSQFCTGHDVAEILGIALRKIIGQRRDVHTWRTEIESGLRLAFSRDEFSKTQIFKEICEWSRGETHRQILR